MKHLHVSELVIFSILTAVLFLAQIVLSGIPNIELVSLLVLVYTLVFGRKVFYIIYTFVFLEGIFYGFGIWWIMYLYVWSILAILTLFLKKQSSVIMWAVVSGAFGLSFGLLCSIPYFFIGGWTMGFSYFIMGIPFDIAHGIGNIIAVLLFFKPVYQLLSYLDRHYRPDRD